MNKRVHHQNCPRARQQGYSMIELSVALVIALFLLNGMFMILQNTRKTSANQTALAQLQDEERVAMTLITDVIQQAGYYPSPQTTDVTTVFPTDTTFGTGGQSIAGGSNTNGDTITVRYQGDSSNAVIDCMGNSLANGSAAEEMQFSVQAGANNNGALELSCAINGGTPVPLVQNVHSLSILYGIDANGTGSTNSYLPQASMTAANWTSVDSVKITVQFVNPLYGQPGQTNNQYISFTRVIGVMARTGVNALTLF